MVDWSARRTIICKCFDQLLNIKDHDASKTQNLLA
jgi:hypothetical protein